MKSISSALFISFVTVGLAACSAKVSDYSKNTYQPKFSKEDMEQNAQDSVKKDFLNSLYLAGQPGKITVKGIVVKKQDDTLLLDNRLVVKQLLGKTYKENSSTTISEKNKPSFSEVVEVSSDANSNQSAPAQEYVNLGCTNLAASETEGLTEKKIEVSQAVITSATKVFICGKLNLSSSFFNISAEEIVLNNAEIVQKNLLGSLRLESKKIRIEGNNKIETIGMDSVVYVMTAPTIDLTVSKEIAGDGSLVLQSQGGNCIQ